MTEKEVAVEVKSNFRRIEAACKLAKTRERNKQWLDWLGYRIIETGIRCHLLSIREVMAAIFVINGLFHKNIPGAREAKDALQTFLWGLRNDPRCEVRKQRKCYLVTVKGTRFGTHIPKALVGT